LVKTTLKRMVSAMGLARKELDMIKALRNC
jgi:hypothetical protein